MAKVRCRDTEPSKVVSLKSRAVCSVVLDTSTLEMRAILRHRADPLGQPRRQTKLLSLGARLWLASAAIPAAELHMSAGKLQGSSHAMLSDNLAESSAIAL